MTLRSELLNPSIDNLFILFSNENRWLYIHNYFKEINVQQFQKNILTKKR